MSKPPADPVKRRLWISLLVLGFLLLAVGALIATLGGDDVAYESPSYRVVQTIEDAGNQGFRILAKYIFGENQAREKVAMTAPVSQERSSSTKIAMTSPVTQERSREQFSVRFMMPSKYTRETLPVPKDSRIQIHEVPAKELAAIQYSGRWTRANYETHLRELVRTLERAKLEPMGEPIWARYDPPFKPWFMRRNEILTSFRRSGSP